MSYIALWRTQLLVSTYGSDEKKNMAKGLADFLGAAKQAVPFWLEDKVKGRWLDQQS